MVLGISIWHLITSALNNLAHEIDKKRASALFLSYILVKQHEVVVWDEALNEKGDLVLQHGALSSMLWGVQGSACDPSKNASWQSARVLGLVNDQCAIDDHRGSIPLGIAMRIFISGEI